MSNEHWTEELTTEQLMHAVKENLRYFLMQADFLNTPGGGLAKANLVESVKRELINSWQAADDTAQELIVRLARHE